jgi:hypothetical protein
MVASEKSGSDGVFPMPPRQRAYELALVLAWVHLRDISDTHLRALGASVAENGHITFDVLGSAIDIDRERGTVEVAGVRAPTELAVCALHYLSANLPNDAPPEAGQLVSFNDIPVMRGYYVPYSGRVLGRLTRRFGAEAADLGSCAAELGGQPEPMGDLGYRFDFFPHVPVRLTYFLGDDEFPPQANMLYNENITGLLPPEDVIVMSELLAARLCGNQWAEMEH